MAFVYKKCPECGIMFCKNRTHANSLVHSPQLNARGPRGPAGPVSTLKGVNDQSYSPVYIEEYNAQPNEILRFKPLTGTHVLLATGKNGDVYHLKDVNFTPRLFTINIESGQIEGFDGQLHDAPGEVACDPTKTNYQYTLINGTYWLTNIFGERTI